MKPTIEAYKTLLSISKSCDRETRSYYVSSSNIDTSNLDRPVKESFFMYSLEPKTDNLQNYVSGVVLGILEDGTLIMAKLHRYDEAKKKLVIQLLTPKKRIRFYAVRSFCYLFYVPLWVKAEAEEREEEAKKPKEARKKPHRKKKEEASGLLLPFDFGK